MPESVTDHKQPAVRAVAAFRLHWISTVILILALVAGIGMTLAVAGKEGIDSFGVESLTKRLFGLVLFPLGVGYLAFRLSRRSNLVGNIVFGLVLSFVTAGTVATFVVSGRRADLAREAQVLREVDALNQKAREAFSSGDPTTGQALSDQAAKKMVEASERRGGNAKLTSDYAARMNRESGEMFLAYQAKLDRFLNVGGFDLRGLHDAATVQQRLDTLAAAVEEHAKVMKYLENVVDRCRADLAAMGVAPNHIESFVRGLNQPGGLESIRRIQKLEHDALNAAAGQFEILKKHAGKWDIDENGSLVAHPSMPETDLNMYNAMAQIMRESIGEQQRLANPAGKSK